MKRVIFSSILAVIVVGTFLTIGLTISAGRSGAAAIDDACSGEAANSPYCQTYRDPKDPMDTFKNVANVITFSGGFIAILWIIFMGIKMATSSGEAQKVTSARNGIIYASVGLLVMVIAQVVIKLLLRNVG